MSAPTATLDRPFPLHPPGEEHALAPPREREGMSLDASRLTFPIAIVVLICSVVGAFFALSARLDVITVKIDAQRDVAAEQARTRAVEIDAIKSAIDVLATGLKEVRSRQDLFNLQVAELKSSIDKQRR